VPVDVILALAFFLFVWIAPIFVGQKLGAPKNRAGWAWGLLLGWLGVIIVACLSEKGRVGAPPAKARDMAQLEAEVGLAELAQRRSSG
jgi:hypothetical protein